MITIPKERVDQAWTKASPNRMRTVEHYHYDKNVFPGYWENAEGDWIWKERQEPTKNKPALTGTQPSPYQQIQTLENILKETKELPVGLWGDFLFPESICLLSGEAGSGKTTLIYNLAGKLSAGKDFLGFTTANPLKILLFDLESPEPLIKRRISLIDDIDNTAISVGRFENFWTEHKRLAEQAKDFDVVVIDPQSLAFQTISEDDNAEAARQMGLLRRFVTDTGVCVILVHHMGKAPQGKGIYKLRGASARAASSDVVINFESMTEDIIRFEMVKNRFIGGNMTIFVKKVEGQFELTRFQGYADSVAIFKAQEAIVELLTKSSEGMARKDIVAELENQGHSSPTVDRAFTPLLQRGKIIKPRLGFYLLKGSYPLFKETKD